MALLVACLAACGDDSTTVVGGSGSGGVPENGSSTSGPPSTSSVDPTPTSASSTSSTTSGEAGGVESSTTTRVASTSAGSSGGLSCNAVCGNGQVDCNEECDCGDDDDCTAERLDFAACVDVQNVLHPRHPFTGGVLGCNAASCRFDTSGCQWGCGDGIVGEGEACDPKAVAPSCADLGRGASTEPLPCSDLCELDASTCQMSRERR